MRKVLPALGAAGAGLAGVGIGLASGLLVELLLVLVALAGAIFSFMERCRLGVALGVLLLGGSVLAALAAVAPITTEDGEYLTGLAASGPVILLLGLALAGTVIALRWGDLEPTWFAVACAVVVALGALSLFLVPGEQVGNPVSVAAAAGVLCLVGMAPGIVAARRA